MCLCCLRPRSSREGDLHLCELAFCWNCFSNDVVFNFAVDRFHHPLTSCLHFCFSAALWCCPYRSEILESSLTTCFILLLLHMLSFNFFLLSNMDITQIFCISLFLLFNTLTLRDLTHTSWFWFLHRNGSQMFILGLISLRLIFPHSYWECLSSYLLNSFLPEIHLLFSHSISLNPTYFLKLSWDINPTVKFSSLNKLFILCAILYLFLKYITSILTLSKCVYHYEKWSESVNHSAVSDSLQAHGL